MLTAPPRLNAGAALFFVVGASSSGSEDSNM